MHIYVYVLILHTLHAQKHRNKSPLSKRKLIFFYPVFQVVCSREAIYYLDGGFKQFFVLPPTTSGSGVGRVPLDSHDGSSLYVQHPHVQHDQLSGFRSRRCLSSHRQWCLAGELLEEFGRLGHRVGGAAQILVGVLDL